MSVIDKLVNKKTQEDDMIINALALECGRMYLSVGKIPTNEERDAFIIGAYKIIMQLPDDIKIKLKF